MLGSSFVDVRFFFLKRFSMHIIFSPSCCPSCRQLRDEHKDPELVSYAQGHQEISRPRLTSTSFGVGFIFVVQFPCCAALCCALSSMQAPVGRWVLPWRQRV